MGRQEDRKNGREGKTSRKYTYGTTHTAVLQSLMEKAFCLFVYWSSKTHFPENMLFGFKKQKSLLFLLNYFLKFKMFSRFKHGYLHLF